MRSIVFSDTTQKKTPGLRALASVVTTVSVLALTACQSTPVKPVLNEEQQLSPKPEIVVTVTKEIQEPVLSESDWRASMQPLFAQARTLVEKATGQNLSHVVLNIASDREITTEVSHETGRLIHKQFNNRRFARHFLDSVMKGQSGTYAALYATRSGQVMVSQPLMQSYQQSLPANQEIREAAILALLIHELVHAADDERYNIHENRDLNFRASFAQSAAFEGHAQFVTRNICKEANCLSGLEALDEFMFGRRNPPNKLTQPVQAVSRNVLEYSYVEGERFITSLAKRPNGKQLLDQLLSNPPQDPIQILDPASFPNTSREQRNQELLAISSNLNHPWLQSPWVSVETSPLKGVNLRTDPSRRNAAVDGFTRLITSMVAMQLYDQSKPGSSPIELTVLRTESNETADLFARTLHANTRVKGAVLSEPKSLLKVAGKDPGFPPARLYVSKEQTTEGRDYFTLVGVSGINVVQVSGVGESQNTFVDYIDQMLLAMTRNSASLTPADSLRKTRF